MLSGITKIPELAISEEESKIMANAAANVARHYNIGASQKVLDWGNLMIVLGSVYGGRIMMMRNRQKEERLARSAPSDTMAGFAIPLV